MAYTDVVQLKKYLKITTSGDDALLGTLATRAQELIDSYCGRSFEGSNADRTFDSVRDVDERDSRILHLDRDLASINTITNGDGSTIASTKYVTEPRNDGPFHAIRLLDSSGLAWEYDSTLGNSENAITVNGVWAWSATAPNTIVQAAERLAGYIYRQRENTPDLDRALIAGNATVLPSTIPADIKWILDPYRRRVYA